MDEPRQNVTREPQVIHKANLEFIGGKPVREWDTYEKKVSQPVPMIRWSGAALVQTIQGESAVGPSFDGYIAVDSQGHPYPIELGVHEMTYERTKFDPLERWQEDAATE